MEPFDSSVRLRSRARLQRRLQGVGRPGSRGLGDGALVAAIAAGDPHALEEAYSQHSGRVHGVALRLCGRARAEDLTQELFLRLWTHPERYRAERGSLRSFLVMEAHGRAVDVLRSDGARIARQSKDFRESPRGPAEHAKADVAALALLERSALHGLVSQLPRSQRDPIALAYFGGLTYRSVARLLTLPEGTVKSRIRTGLARLRADLSPDLDITS